MEPSSITNLLAGTFDLTVSVQGFKPYEQKGIVLGATERLALQTIALEVGGLSEVVSVAAESLKVQTTSGERSATMTAAQIEDVGLRGRDFMGSLKVLPGVIDTSARDAPGWGSVGNMSINGQTSFNFSYDGVTNKDTGSNSGNYAAPGARLDRRGQGPGLELPGRVRPQLRRDDHRRHQERHAATSAAPRRTTSATKRSTPTAGIAAASAMPASPPDAATWPELREGAVPVRQHRLDARRPGADPRHRASTAIATSCSSSSRRICCRATIRARCS